MTEPIPVALIGAGQRGGDVYGEWIRAHPDRVRLVALAEPRARRRDEIAAAHQVPDSMCFRDGEELLARDRLAAALILATPDQQHAEVLLRAAGRGYHVLCEKPIAPSEDELLRVRGEIRREGLVLEVAHVLRYTEFFRSIRSLLDAGRIGRLQTVQLTENVGFWHYAHSYVRGNWRNLAGSAPFLLAKSCHDLDLLRWFADSPCVRVSSEGSLGWFRPENAPEGAPARCTDGCPVEADCPYAATRFYLEDQAGNHGWPVSVLGPDTSPRGRRQSLEEGPYGRCVYACDNDVADHQVVSLGFANGVTASLTVSGFTRENTRTVKLMGSHGEIRGHLGKGEVEVAHFASGARECLHFESRARGHAGGDEALMESFVSQLEAHRDGRPTGAPRTGFEEALESHFMALAAERSRLSGCMVTL